MLLGRVIKKYLNDVRLNAVATKGAWLGNDESHYVRKWKESDIEDLKVMINLTVKWIEMMELSEEAVRKVAEASSGSTNSGE